MNTENAKTLSCGRSTPSELLFLSIVLMALLTTGCKTVPPGDDVTVSERGVSRTFAVEHLTPEQCEAFLRPLGLEHVECVSNGDANAVAATGSPVQLKRAALILDLADSREQYCIDILGPASMVRTLPSNQQIAAALGRIAIGTFDEPPAAAARARGIIDIHEGSVLAIVPLRYRERLRTLLTSGRTVSRQGTEPKETLAIGEPDDGRPAETAVAPEPAPVEAIVTLAEMADPCDSDARAKPPETPSEETETAGEQPMTTRISFTPAHEGRQAAGATAITDRAMPENGEELLDMTLPETITLIQLLDLAGKYLGLNYVYDPREINNTPISLKLHGNLQGEMKIRHLYKLLETVLDFMGLAMIRQEENFVAVVPMDKALQTQPELVDGDYEAVQVGDTVVTRVFNIRHVDVGTIITLLQNMKLSASATPLENANLLLVTCHAGRMNRIEQLVEMIDQPGRPTECRFRRLSYVRATPLIAKIRTLAEELEGIAVATAPAAAKPATPQPKPPTAARPADSAGRRPVYLDADERTNRIMMVGFGEELTIMEQLVDVLDVAQEDPRAPHIYAVRHLDATKALDKLETLEVLKTAVRGAAAPEQAAAGTALTGEPLVAVLELTNQLLVRAAPDQHMRIREFLGYIDVAPADNRTIAAYRIQHIDVHVAQRTLEELDLVTVDTKASSFISGPNQPAGPQAGPIPILQPAGNPLQKAPIVVSESTKALIVKATAEQHARIAAIIKYIDRYTAEEQLTYQVYPLESSTPDHLAGLLERLITETTRDTEGKIEKVTPRTKEQISVVPDPNTFSLIVYASEKNQRWIGGLIKRLDKRRPQVLIDVTLVEVTRTDSFEYDLSLVAAANGAVTGNIVIDPVQTLDSGSRLEGGFNLLDSDGNPTGRTRAFYSDRHVQALLTAIQRKNYGRVLAKPKVLVDDGREGRIMTTEATTYVQESIQIPQTGTPITTREFVPIEASIKLQITPHISEGNLLRLDVFMSRDDFGSRPSAGAPPDKATSEVTTTVFVPDSRTVILGGLVKLNQSKGGSKVPILGDIPLVGALFRSVDNSDIERKLYVFLKANIVRPYDEYGLVDLEEISEEHQRAFEQSESEFQRHENIPGIPPEPMEPKGVLRDYK